MLSSLSIVIPTYNESGRIIHTIHDILSKVSLFTNNFEIIIVDDGSLDTTRDDIEKEFCSIMEKSVVRCIPIKHQGKGAAVKQGMLSSKKEWILFMDADNSASIDSLAFFQPFVHQYEIMIGSRAIKDGTLTRIDKWHRKIMGGIFNSIMRKMMKLPYLDTQCGFKLFTRSCGQLISHDVVETGFAFDVEILSLAKLFHIPVKEVGIHWKNSDKSQVSVMRDPWRMLCALYRIKKKHVLHNLH
ncbi:MAG: hypothetical protein CO030_00630 [Candidatus Magasanikbacteria bacterium CG_4_9_14_0_2_um_filter_42_11]|uniref:Glycosyltransferase 2-like domain-containing protein n=1 Tax=Candidatus Magasanikbacteria bacterium CG_4_9_14_0_2_um_filter_42_11 TaxID=1974643 RepID=A0A2M8FB05_9BACT|nr:MAG: hypothetical protein COU34_02195 [Candidatus Magasanikbacteria bacterium CG10_big_fil_rev_8_21_14_0_10_43_9]PJC52859.1 MAG: hypothetical protein CO030_00630 [Candidatus Magasanikbacteria bacterium CG_4_9_14_0_2_um_filter_42_11]